MIVDSHALAKSIWRGPAYLLLSFPQRNYKQNIDIDIVKI